MRILFLIMEAYYLNKIKDFVHAYLAGRRSLDPTLEVSGQQFKVLDEEIEVSRPNT